MREGSDPNRADHRDTRERARADSRRGEISGKHCVTASPADEAPIVSALYETREEAEEAQSRLQDHYPGACLAYWPTQDEHERWQRWSEWVSSFDVEYWQVMRERRLENGATGQEALSPRYANRQQAEEAVAAIREDQPDAYVMRGEVHYHPDKADDMRRREAFIVSMVGEPA